MENSKQSEAFFEMFKEVRSDIADGQGYPLAKAIMMTFDRWHEWQSGMPDFDGQYLVLIKQEQECKNILKYMQVIECRCNNWVLKDKEKVLGWRKLSNEDNQ